MPVLVLLLSNMVQMDALLVRRHVEWNGDGVEKGMHMELQEE